MNINAWAKDVIARKERVAIPIMTHPGIELIGKKVIEIVTDGKVQFEAIKALNEKYPSAACNVMMDLTVEAEAFGAHIVMSDDDVPTITGRLVSDHESVEKLQIPDLKAGRLPEYILATRLVAENIKDKPVFGGMIGPFSLAGRLFDMTEIMIACYTEPETATLLLDKCTEFLINYCKEIKAQGVQGVIIAEPAAGLLSNDGCTEFSSVYVKRIVDALQDDTFMVILHNCGNTGHCTQAMIATGANGYHFGNKIDMVKALEGCPQDLVAMGNIDPVSMFKSATPAEMKAATLDLLHRTTDFPNFILSSGCDIPPHIPHANIEAFYEALDEYNKGMN